MKDSSRYVKIVEWSEEDQCFVGDDEVVVYQQLCQIVEEWLELIKADGKPLPPATYSLSGVSFKNAA